MFQIRGLADAWTEAASGDITDMSGSEDRAAASAYCGKKYGITSPNFQPCVDFYAGPHRGEFIPITPTGTPTLPTVNASSIATKWGVTMSPQVVTGQLRPSVVSQLVPPGVPWYKTPLGIGAIVLVAFLGYRRFKR